MYRFAVLVFALVLLSVWTEAALAQATDPALLMRRWATSQAEAGEGIERITFEERTERVLDGPFGKRTVRLHARITGSPDGGDWRRDILTVSINGRPLAPREYDHLRFRHFEDGSPTERLLEDLLIPSKLFAGMQPAGPATRVQFGTGPALRFDMVPSNARSPIRRVTIWMDIERAHLLKTRTVFEQPVRGSTMHVTTTYDHVGGFDVPIQRSIEGTIRTRRRLRTFTLLLRVESEFTDHHIDRS